MSPKPYFNKARKLLLGLVAIFFFVFQSAAQNSYLSFTDPLIKQSEASLPERSVVEMGNNLIVQFNFSGAQVSEANRDSGTFQYLRIPGFTKIARTGAPALPVHNELIALPPGGESGIHIPNTEYIEYTDFKIHPALKPARDTEGFPEPEFEINPEIYNKDAFYPENTVKIIDTLYIRGIPLILVQVCPVQFNPVTGIIRVYSKVEFKIAFDAKAGFDQVAQKNSRHFTGLLKRNVLNSDDIPDGIKASPVENAKSIAKNYIIITHSVYENQANQLADWKRQLGYSVEVVSASSWTATDVKDAIHSRYAAWTPKPDYFVIIGDHSGSYAVPGEIRYAGYGEAFATDLYYACMDGASDWHPDMAHGRISVSNVTEAQTVVDKIINYEKNPVNNTAYYSNALTCAQYQDDDNNGYADRRFCHTSEDIRNYLQTEQSYNTERIYYTSTSADITTLRYNNNYYSNGQLLPAELRSYSFNWNGGETEITSSINAGKFLVFHRDHGYVGGSGWAHPYYTTGSMNSLSNGNLLPVVFSMNCHTGEFQLSNCFAEKFIRMSGKGAVGVFAAAYYSYSGYNDGLSDGMIDAIWSDPGLYPVMGTAGTGNNYTIGPGNSIYTMGDVLNQGLFAMEQNVGWSNDRQYQYELFHWFGDPAMKIWTENPHNNIISATHTSTIDCDGSSFSISASTPGATATLVYNNSILGKTVLDNFGNGNIGYDITSPGSQVKLCISKVNHKPYLSNLTITGNCGFPPAMNTGGATYVLDISATVSGEILNDFGSRVTESGIVYSEQPGPVIGGNNVTKVETNPCITTGIYNLELNGLQSSTTYYYRAYAINANGSGYGSDQNFTTSCGLITLPYTRNFDNSAFPDCWTQESTGGATDRWIVSNTLYSGGQAYEMMAEWEDINPATSRLITPPINTTGLAEMYLKFRYFFDDFDNGVTVKIQSSSDGINWTDESWSLNSGNGNMGPELVETTITNNLNNPNTYVAFVIEGNLYQFDYWYVDEVELTAPALTDQTIQLSQGWNITSFYPVPADKNMMNILQPLIDSNNLYKVLDESGNFIQEIPGAGWLNTIGDMENTEGYYIKINEGSSLQLLGSRPDSVTAIPLSCGWNIMGYPRQDTVNGLYLLQPLINDTSLVKVLDESGNFIQFIPGTGWINTIGDFMKGEGYYIKVSDTCQINMGFTEWLYYDYYNENSYSSVGYGEPSDFSVAIRFEPSQLIDYTGGYLSQIKFFPDEPQADYYVRVWTGNGAANLILDQLVTNPVTGQWNTIDLNTALPIDISQELWIGYRIIASEGYPAGGDEGPAVSGFGDMIYNEFSGWESLSNSYGIDINWLIRGLVTTYTDSSKILGSKDSIPEKIPRNLNIRKEILQQPKQSKRFVIKH